MSNKRLLAVWAHPDDEAFGPVGTMRMAVDRGWETAVISATRGDAGKSQAAHLAPGQTLGDFRENELRCSCGVLGVSQLHVWRHSDGGLRDLPPEVLVDQVLSVMRDWQPTIVITFGPDGVTGHSDHIAISHAAETAFTRYRAEQTEFQPRLYYNTIPDDRVIEHPMGDAPPPRPATTVIDVGAYEAIKREALRCHESQRADWEPLLADHDWLTIDRLFRVFPPVAPDEPVAGTIFDE